MWVPRSWATLTAGYLLPLASCVCASSRPGACAEVSAACVHDHMAPTCCCPCCSSVCPLSECSPRHAAAGRLLERWADGGGTWCSALGICPQQHLLLLAKPCAACSDRCHCLAGHLGSKIYLSYHFVTDDGSSAERNGKAAVQSETGAWGGRAAASINSGSVLAGQAGVSCRANVVAARARFACPTVQAAPAVAAAAGALAFLAPGSCQAFLAPEPTAPGGRRGCLLAWLAHRAAGHWTAHCQTAARQLQRGMQAVQSIPLESCGIASHCVQWQGHSWMGGSSLSPTNSCACDVSLLRQGNSSFQPSLQGGQGRPQGRRVASKAQWRGHKRKQTAQGGQHCR